MKLLIITLITCNLLAVDCQALLDNAVADLNEANKEIIIDHTDIYSNRSAANLRMYEACIKYMWNPNYLMGLSLEYIEPKQDDH